MSTNEAAPHAAQDGSRDAEWQQIRDALHGLRYGAVTIIVQDGVVIQIDRTEKRRLRRSASGAANCP